MSNMSRRSRAGRTHPKVGPSGWSSHPGLDEVAVTTAALEAQAGRAAEEVLNALTHGLGVVVVTLMSPFLIAAAPAGGVRASAVIYCVTMLMLFGASTLYHAVEETLFAQQHEGKWSLRFQTLDHVAIYLFIAGSYTPFIIVSLSHSSWRWPTLVTVWCIAIAGIVFKLLGGVKHRRLSLGSYLLLGWISVAIVPELFLGLSAASFALLAAGGFFYTAGVYFYWRDHRRFHHAIWHLFVLAGAGCHLASIANILQSAPS